MSVNGDAAAQGAAGPAEEAAEAKGSLSPLPICALMGRVELAMPAGFKVRSG